MNNFQLEPRTLSNFQNSPAAFLKNWNSSTGAKLILIFKATNVLFVVKNFYRCIFQDAKIKIFWKHYLRRYNIKSRLKEQLIMHHA